MTGTRGGLSLRVLNRTTLARQRLLTPSPWDDGAVVSRVAGIQAQVPGPPYVGLFARVARFERGWLAEALAARSLVRATLWRATLHLVTATDFARFRPIVQPVLTRTMSSMQRARGLDATVFAPDARALLHAGPRTFGDVRAHLTALHPTLDAHGMAFAVRMTVPLVQVPGNGTWGFAADAPFALATQWLGRELDAPGEGDLREVVRRYLAAFGPASVRDAQTWSGLTRLADVFASMRDELVTFTSDAGTTLYDRADATREPEDAPAPVRLLPEYDNLLLGHADRSRVLPSAFRDRVFVAPQVRATVLVDGFVRATWRIERTKQEATVAIEPLARLSKPDREAVVEEALRVARFVAPDAARHAVRFVTG